MDCYPKGKINKCGERTKENKKLFDQRFICHVIYKLVVFDAKRSTKLHNSSFVLLALQTRGRKRRGGEETFEVKKNKPNELKVNKK